MTDKRRFPDPQELAIFLEVAKQRSFSQAALRLGVTTSSVSQSVTHLEKSLDATLVNRAHRPIELTCAGDRLYRKSGPILNELERTVRELKPAPGFYPEVRLGLSESVSGTLSPCLLQKIRTVSNRITVSTGFTNTLAKNFQNGEIDILISGRTFVNEADLWRGTILSSCSSSRSPGAGRSRKKIRLTRSRGIFPSSPITISLMTRVSCGGSFARKGFRLSRDRAWSRATRWWNSCPRGKDGP